MVTHILSSRYFVYSALGHVIFTRAYRMDQNTRFEDGNFDSSLKIKLRHFLIILCCHAFARAMFLTLLKHCLWYIIIYRIARNIGGN